MTHEFLLKPDLKLLKKYEYLKLSNVDTKKIEGNGGKIHLGVPSIVTNTKDLRVERKKIDDGMEKLKLKYPINEIYDTLLYVCLHQAGEYQSQLILQWENYINSIAIKQLASFVDALENWNNIKSITIKSIEKDTQITLDHPELIQWLPQKLGKALYNPNLFIQGSKKELSHFNKKDWQSLKNIKPTAYKKLKGKNQSIFILQVLNFIRNETQIATKTSAKLYRTESEFIYDIGRILNVFDEAANIYSADSFIRSILKYNKTA